MNPSTELADEMDMLRAELESKCIQVEALTRFEQEFSRSAKDLLDEKELRIRSLEDQVGVLSIAANQGMDAPALLELLKRREMDVEVLEAKVADILKEGNARSAEQRSLTDSFADYEFRLENLRTELIAKDAEIHHLRDLLQPLPSPSPSPEPITESPRLLSISSIQAFSTSPPPQFRDQGTDAIPDDQTQSLHAKMATLMLQLEKQKEEFLESSTEKIAELVQDLGADGLVHVCLQQVAEYKRTSARYKTERDLLRTGMAQACSRENLRELLYSVETAICDLNSQSDALADAESIKAENAFLRQQVRDMVKAAPSSANAITCVESATSARKIEYSPRVSRMALTVLPIVSHQPTSPTPQLSLSMRSYPCASIPPPPLPITSQDSLGSITTRLNEELKVRRKIEASNEALTFELEKLRKRALVDSGVNDLEAELRAKSDLIAKLRVENRELVMSMGVRNSESATQDLSEMLAEIDQLRSDLRAKEAEVRSIRTYLAGVKRDSKQVEYERDRLEAEVRKLEKVVVGTGKVKRAVVGGEDVFVKAEMEKLRSDIDTLKRVAGRNAVTPKAATTAKRVVNGLSMHSFVVVSVVGKGVSDPAVGAVGLVGGVTDQTDHVYDVIRRLQDKVAETEEALIHAQRQIRVETPIAVESERVRREQLEIEAIDLRSKLAESQYQLRAMRFAHDGYEVPAVVPASAGELARLQNEQVERSLEVVRLHSRVLELEFELTVVERRYERVLDKNAVLKEQCGPRQPKRDSGVVESAASAELVKCKSELTQVQSELRNSESELSRRGKEIAELEKQVKSAHTKRAEDRAAIEEAERLVTLVEQTESKYLKAMKENAKLRRDIAALNDDAFWADLETLQSQHKLCVDVLRECKSLVRDARLANAIGELVGDQ